MRIHATCIAIGMHQQCPYEPTYKRIRAYNHARTNKSTRMMQSGLLFVCISSLYEDLMERLESTASAKGWSRNDVFREALRTYLRQDAIRSELSEFESRMAATCRELDRQMKRLRNDLQILMAFFDLFTRSYFVHTPSIPAAAVDTAAVGAKLRYERLLRQLPEVLQGVRGLISISANLDSGSEP
jgi:hypothetical protein